MATFMIMSAGAFSGSNSLFSMFSNSEAESRNKALAQAQIDKEKRAHLADMVREELQWQGHALQSFKNVDEALEEYYSLTKINLEANLGKEPTPSDYYTPSDSTKQAEIIGITVGMAITAYTAYRYSRVIE